MKTKFDGVRSEIMEKVSELLSKMDYDVLRTGSQEICIPIVGEEGEEGYLKMTFVIPKGERGGDPYNGYDERDAYSDKVRQDKEKAEAKAKAKAEKIARDKALREAKAKAKAKRE